MVVVLLLLLLPLRAGGTETETERRLGRLMLRMLRWAGVGAVVVFVKGLPGGWKLIFGVRGGRRDGLRPRQGERMTWRG